MEIINPYLLMNRKYTIGKEVDNVLKKSSIGLVKFIYYTTFSFLIPLIISMWQPSFFILSIIICLMSLWFVRKVAIPAYAKKKGIKYIQ